MAVIVTSSPPSCKAFGKFAVGHCTGARVAPGAGKELQLPVQSVGVAPRQLLCASASAQAWPSPWLAKPNLGLPGSGQTSAGKYLSARVFALFLVGTKVAGEGHGGFLQAPGGGTYPGDKKAGNPSALPLF